MKIRSLNKEEKNSLLLILFLYCNILTFPIVKITGTSLPFWIILCIIVSYSIFINRCINKKLIFIFITFSIIFLINLLVVSYRTDVLSSYGKFIRFGICALYLTSVTTDYKSLYKYMFVVSLASLLINNAYLNYFQSNNGYMDLGLNLTYSFFGFVIYYYNNNKLKLISLFLIVITAFEILLFGNRSSFIVCLLLILFFEFKRTKVKSFKDATNFSIKLTIYFLLTYFLLFRLASILGYINNQLSQMGYFSYSLTKYVLTLQEGSSGILEQSSGRDDLYPRAISMITDSNFMPHGVGYFPYATDYSYPYPHNLFIEVTLDFGIIGLFLFILVWVYLIIKYFKYKKYNPYFGDLVGLLFIYSFTRLMFSGTYWQESFYWALIGLILFHRNRNIKNLEVIS